MVQQKVLKIKEITESVKKELKDLTGFDPSSVISIKKDGETWKVVVELLEKTGIPDRMDILGIYEASVDMQGALIEYGRKGLRKRGDTAGQEVDEEDR
jgi:hypothetical protein